MQKTASESRNTLTMLLLVGATILFFANNHILAVSIPLLINDMGFGLHIIGYSTAGMGLVTILMKFLTPSIMKSMKFRILIFLDLFCIALITLGFILCKTSPIAIIVLRTLFGAPFSLFPIINLVVITTIAVNKDDLIQGVSWIGMAMPISMMLSPALTELLLKHFSYEAAFYAALISSVLCICVYMFGLSLTTNVEETRGSQAKTPPMAFRDITSLFKNRTILLPIIAFFFLGVIDMLVITYYPLIATNGNRTYSFYFTIFSISMVLSQKYYRHIQISTRSKLIIGYFLLGVATLLAGLSSYSFYVFSILSAISFGVGFSLTETTTNTLMLLKKETATIFLTIQQLSISLGRTIGPWFIAIFSKNIDDLTLCFILIALFQILPISMMYFIKSNNESEA